MSTHNIGFYEEISKIITELSSIIIKYAPYFFCCYSHFLFFFFCKIKLFCIDVANCDPEGFLPSLTATSIWIFFSKKYK